VIKLKHRTVSLDFSLQAFPELQFLKKKQMDLISLQPIVHFYLV